MAPRLEINNYRPQHLHPPRHILATSPVSQYHGYHHGTQLPLNLILLITSYLDDVADIARVTRASRLLYYLNLPKLYENVTLHSYPDIRYIDGRPEGFGAGSPFSMALDGLVSRNVSGYVRSFGLVGLWKECDIEEFQKGRVPDNTMMLNIVVRAALDKMDKLQSFSWELNSKPLRTVYQGLASRQTLTSLTVKFPSNRIPRPTVIIPPIPNLRYVHLVDIDPLCYPDDPSLLLLGSKKLEELKLEFSPRMRREKEPSVSLHTYFGRCVAANYRIPLKHLAMKNLYCRKDNDMENATDQSTLESATMINCVDPTDPGTIFYDATWILQQPEAEKFTKLKSIRIDRLDNRGGQPMMQFSNFEEVYFVNRDSQIFSRNGSSENSPGTPCSIDSQKSLVSIGSSYLAAITSRHGSTIKKLLLSDLWSLGSDTIKHLLISCPNLEQLAVAVEYNNFELMHSILIHAPKLKALRILLRAEEPVYNTIKELSTEQHCREIGRHTWRDMYMHLRWFGMGPCYFELRNVVSVPDAPDGQPKIRRVVRPVSWDVIKEVEIWGKDTLDI